MDFIVGLPRTRNCNDSMWVIVDRLTKSAHFLLVKTNYTVDVLGRFYVWEIAWCDGFHRLRSRFILYIQNLKTLQEALDTPFDLSNAYHHRWMARRRG